jgi:hypothetical protein
MRNLIMSVYCSACLFCLLVQILDAGNIYPNSIALSGGARLVCPWLELEDSALSILITNRGFGRRLSTISFY